MIQPLDKTQQSWVDKTLASLSRDEQLAQLLIPMCPDDATVDHLAGLMQHMPIGSVFVAHASLEDHRRRITRLQEASRVPLVIAADLECGAGHIVKGAVPFPDPLALAAADREELAHTMGKASAIEGRHAGIHWTYAPVVDVNVHPDNPIANTRSLGDDPARVSRLSRAILKGMQENGLAACVKHFPGDGIDDMDQHTVTTVNSLPMNEWRRISGKTFQDAFEAGVWSIMIGHIALPAWDDERDYRGAYRPATVNRKITTDLLRGNMGFQGLVITDDMNMGGVAGFMGRRARLVGCIAAGCDMILFPRLPEDFPALQEAADRNELSAERIREAARRVLEFKARLGLHTGELFGRGPTPVERSAFEAASKRMAESSITLVRDFGKLLPLKELKPGAKVLTITLSTDSMDVPDVDGPLRARGFVVEHQLNPTLWDLWQRASNYDAIFLNFVYKAAWAVQTVRSVGPQNRTLMGGWFNEHPCVVFTSFGSPYHLRMFSTLPNLVNVHGASPDSQRAAVAAWFGGVPMTAKSPVGNLTREPRQHFEDYRKFLP